MPAPPPCPPPPGLVVVYDLWRCNWWETISELRRQFTGIVCPHFVLHFKHTFQPDLLKMSFAALRNRRDWCLFLSFMNPDIFSCFESGRISNFADHWSVSFIIFHWMFLELTVCLYKRNSKSLWSFSKMLTNSRELLLYLSTEKNLQKPLLQQPQEMIYGTGLCVPSPGYI